MTLTSHQENDLLIDAQKKLDISIIQFNQWEDTFLKARDLLTENRQNLNMERISFLNDMILLSEEVNKNEEIDMSRKLTQMRHVLELRAEILSEFILLNGRIQQSRLILYDLIEELYSTRRTQYLIKDAIRYRLIERLLEYPCPDYLWAENNFCWGHFDFTDSIEDLQLMALEKVALCRKNFEIY